MTTKIRALGFIATTLVLAGCGTTLAPRELESARDAYKKAEAGPARTLTPASLDDAKQALDRAEQSFKDDSDSVATRHLSYIAMRRAEIANATGKTQAYMGEVEKAKQDKLALHEQLQKKTSAKLSATEKKLEDERRARERAAEDAARREKELKETAAKTKAELAAEREARKKLEGKYMAALASLKEVAKVKEEKRGVVITLSGEVLFATGKWELLPLAQNKLADVAKALKDQGFKAITVEGHTDSRGSADNNRVLSMKRADAVRDYLISQGIPADKIRAVGRGEDAPVASNKTPEGRANNRRVELVVTPED